MSTSKHKLNGLKRQRDKLKVCFPIDILGSPLCPVDSVKNLNFSSSEHVQNVCKSCFVKHDFRHVKQFLTHDASVLVANALVVVSWITVTHFSGASLSSMYVYYSSSKIVRPELYQKPGDTPV